MKSYLKKILFGEEYNRIEEEKRRLAEFKEKYIMDSKLIMTYKLISRYYTNGLMYADKLSEKDAERLFIEISREAYREGRGKGNTTRVVDYAIQFFFTVGFFKMDMFILEGDEIRRFYTFQLLKERIQREHNHIMKDCLKIWSNDMIRLTGDCYKRIKL